MKILQVVGTPAPFYGGSSVACPELSLVRQGHKVSIYGSDVSGKGHLDVPLSHPIMDEGVEVYYFRARTRPDKYLFSPSLWRALAESVAQFDIVQIWSLYGFFTTAAAYWCRKRGVPKDESARAFSAA